MSEVKWKVIYPCYINKAKTIHNGWRVSKKQAIENPKGEEIIDVLTENGFPAKMD